MRVSVAYRKNAQLSGTGAIPTYPLHMMRGRAVVAHWSHKPIVKGSIPFPATRW